MRTVAEIIQVWPRSIDLARDLGISPPRITDWKKRNSIPVEYWRELIRAARKRGRAEVTADLLVDVHARKRALQPHGFNEEERHFKHSEPQPRSGDEDGKPIGTGHFSRFKHVRRNNFKTAEEIEDHIRALRDEWSHR